MSLKIEWANSDSRIEISQNPDYTQDWIVKVVYEADTNLTHEASVVLSHSSLVGFLATAQAFLQSVHTEGVV